MQFNCRLASCCLDCDKAHIDVYNKIARTPGGVLMTTLASTLYCRHMGVCAKYQAADLGDQIVLVPVNALGALDEPNSMFFNDNAEYNADVTLGDGINE